MDDVSQETRSEMKACMQGGHGGLCLGVAPVRGAGFGRGDTGSGIAFQNGLELRSGVWARVPLHCSVIRCELLLGRDCDLG